MQRRALVDVFMGNTPMLMRNMLVAVSLLVFPMESRAQDLQFGRTSEGVNSALMIGPGTLVEAVGLNRWTLEMVQDSLKARGVSLFGARGRLRQLPLFPQGVVYQSRGDSAVTVFVALIEPQDDDLVTVRDLGNDTTGSSAPWPVLVDLARAPLNVLESGMLTAIHAQAVGLEPRLSLIDRADSAELTSLWNTLRAHRTSADAATARRLLSTSAKVYDRVAAMVMLSNFGTDDAAWHALVGALLDPSDVVREYARSVLRTFTSDFTRRVDWAPAATDLHALLQGSDLIFLPELLDMLVATRAGPEMAGPLLKNGGHAVLMFAGAQNPWARGPAYRFLRAVSGKRAAVTPDEWRAWIDTL